MRYPILCFTGVLQLDFFGVGIQPLRTLLAIRRGHAHVGLIAEIQPEKQDKFHQDVRQFRTDAVMSRIEEAGIIRLQFFTRTIDTKQYAVAYFCLEGGKAYLEAAKMFEQATQSIEWQSTTTAHPRAKLHDTHWLQMEWICLIRGLEVEREPTSAVMNGTTIKPEKEAEYRSLHQTVWPGVVDQVVRGNIRNLNIYFVELDDKLVEFLYLEYMGNDEKADDKANKLDAINQRWWKLTDPCQEPFSDVTEGTWSPLNSVE